MSKQISAIHEALIHQCPQFSHLSIYRVEPCGHDNQTYHLGSDYSIRIPSDDKYVAQITKEWTWLPYLQSHLSYPISHPIFLGQPTKDIPYPWLINKWIEGKTLLEENPNDLCTFATELSQALKELQSIPPINAPKAGKHNFYRGGSLHIYHKETCEALSKLKNELPTEKLYAIFKEALNSSYTDEGVFVHGDVAMGNILLKGGHFYALIDFGILGVGDPACDYAMAWTYFTKKSRPYFLKNLSLDCIQRARGWALWKALITYYDENPVVRNNARYTIKAILDE